MLNIHGLNKAYQHLPVLKDIALSVQPASRTVIVGPSGSGKSTLLKIIAGFDAADSGEITLNGRPLFNASLSLPAHKRGIGYVPQDGMLFPHLTVAGNIAFGLKGDKREVKIQVGELLERVSLPGHYAQRWPHELSGGQQQRVALARSLAQKPLLMLLDEPFSALDTGLRAATREGVKTLLSDEGIACIMVTHDQSEALSFAQQLGVMSEGQLIQLGTPQELYHRPADEKTARLLGDVMLLPVTYHENQIRSPLGNVSIDTDFGSDAAARQIMIRPEQLTCKKSAQPTGIRLENIEFAGARSSLTFYLEATRQRFSFPYHTVYGLERGCWLQIDIQGSVHLL